MEQIKETNVDNINEQLYELKNTIEDEALRLADSFYPITATGITNYADIKIDEIRFKIKNLIEFALFINDELEPDEIIDYAIRFCVDYKTLTADSDWPISLWFGIKEINQFIKACKKTEKTLFDN